jgi:hypothetical protein
VGKTGRWWHKSRSVSVQVNGIPTKSFRMEGIQDGSPLEAPAILHHLKDENAAIAKAYTEGSIPIDPKWMSSLEQRLRKRHSSIILTFSNQAAADRVKAESYYWVLGQARGITEYKT